jgi:hypothetical protein
MDSQLTGKWKYDLCRIRMKSVTVNMPVKTAQRSTYRKARFVKNVSNKFVHKLGMNFSIDRTLATGII